MSVMKKREMLNINMKVKKHVLNAKPDGGEYSSEL